MEAKRENVTTAGRGAVARASHTPELFTSTPEQKPSDEAELHCYCSTLTLAQALRVTEKKKKRLRGFFLRFGADLLTAWSSLAKSSRWRKKKEKKKFSNAKVCSARILRLVLLFFGRFFALAASFGVAVCGSKRNTSAKPAEGRVGREAKASRQCVGEAKRVRERTEVDFASCMYNTQHLFLPCLYILHLSGYLKKTQSTAFYMPPNVSFKISLNSAAFVSCKSPAKIGFKRKFSLQKLLLAGLGWLTTRGVFRFFL